MKKAIKLFLLVILLNIARYLLGGAIEMFTIMEPMHAVIPQFPEVFDTQFSAADFAISFFYNFMLWLTATWVFHIAHPALRGGFILKSFKVFGLMCLFFVSLAAVYMNHYIDPIKVFYIWSMVDAVILFSVVAFANGLLYPKVFKGELARQSRSRNIQA